MDLYLELHVFGAVPVRKKDETLVSLYFQVFPWHSLVELTEHDDSAVDIILHSMYVELYIYMHCCIHST